MSILYGESISITPVSSSDLEELYAMNMNYDISSGTGFWIDMPNFSTYEKWMQSYLQGEDKTKIHFVIVDEVSYYTDDEGRTYDVLGVVSAFNMSDLHRTAEVAVMVKPEQQGKGIATQAVSLVLKYLFGIRGYRKVYAQIYEDNAASIGLFKGLGFEGEAYLKEHEMHLGKYTGVLIYSKWNRRELVEDTTDTTHGFEEDTWG